LKPIREFVADLARLDIRLWIEDGKLRCSAPRDALTSDLQRQLADRRQELRAFLDGAGKPAGGEALPRRPDPGSAPLSFGQERIWSLCEMQPDSAAYNIATVFRLRGPVNRSALEQSLGEIERRHEILRTSFPVEDGVPRQRIHPPMPFVLPVVDLANDLRVLPPDVGTRELERLVHAEARRAFDLKAGPLWRARLFLVAEREYLLSLTMHHMIYDGASKPILLRELEALYGGFIAREPAHLPDLPAQFGDFAHWQRTSNRDDVMERQIGYWKAKLHGAVPPLSIPIDRPRQGAGDAQSGVYPFALSQELTARLLAWNRTAQVSPFITLLCAFYALLNRTTGQEDLLVCTPYACRDRPELEAMIGYFNNIVALRANLAGDPSLRELTSQVRQVALEAHDNQNVPLQRLMEFGSLARTPLNRAMFTFQDTTQRALDLRGVTASPVALRKAEPDFELAMYMESNGPRWSGILEYNADLFERRTIEALVSHFQAVLERYVSDPDARLSQLPGFRAAPADVEGLLTSHPGIDRAVVVPARDRGTLTAYLVLNEFTPPGLDEVRAFARRALPEFQVPAAFVPLDTIPLAMDGSVDLAALPQADAARGEGRAPSVAPRTPLERSIADLWRKVLWLDGDVGIHDDFHDLGGHSLLAVELLTRIEGELRRKVPMEALSRLTTVAALAELLERESASSRDAWGKVSGARGEPRPQTALSPEIYRGLRTYLAAWPGHRASPASLIVGQNIEGSRQPIYWCLQREGEMTQLAKYLGVDQPLYAMRSGNRVMVKSHENIDALGAQYAAEIADLQPDGPLVVGGNCQAARIAFQIAEHLQRRGREITLLVLMEKFIPRKFGGRVALLFGAQSDRNPYLYFRRPEAGWAKYYSGPFTVDMIPGGHGHFFEEPNVQALAATIGRRVDAARQSGVPPTGATGGAGQALPESAYRAALTATVPPSVGASQRLSVPVKVTNLGTVTWSASSVSGVFIANRWLTPEGQVIAHLDGAAGLPRDLTPGASDSQMLTITAPAVAGAYLLELDLVDEGVAWFRTQGSKATYLPVDVRG
jgi:thioesterase domain-containing protein/acyl carrier protein